MMKAHFIFLFSLSLLLSSCDGLYTPKTRTSYILSFYEIDGIAANGRLTTIEGKNYAKIDIYAPTITMISDIFDKDKRLFKSLCQKYGDTDYPQKQSLVYPANIGEISKFSYPSKRLSSLEISSNGVLINNQTHFMGVSLYPYIKNDYKRCNYRDFPFSRFFRSELDNILYEEPLYFNEFDDNLGDERQWYPIDKRVDRLTEDDICLLGHGGLSPQPEGSRINNWNTYQYPPKACPDKLNLDPFYYNLFSLFIPIDESAEAHSYEIRLKDEDGTVFTTKVVL